MTYRIEDEAQASSTPCPYEPCPCTFALVSSLLTHVAHAHQDEVIAETRTFLAEERTLREARRRRTLAELRELR